MATPLPSENDVEAVFQRHNGDLKSQGWKVRMRHLFGYHSTADWYEATVDRLVTPGCKWIDVGGGKTVFPQNPKLATELSNRCQLLVGVDPSENINQNQFVHERVMSSIEDFQREERFDLATLRMVAEHMEHPEQVVATLARLVKPGGQVVIYTPNRWAPVAVAASIIPNKWHTFFTHLLWNTNDEDVFPTVYKMNTRKALLSLFQDGGFVESQFAYLSDCSTLSRFRITYFLELCLWRLLRAVGVTYPENVLLGIYRRV